MNKTKINTKEFDAEFGLDSRYASDAEHKSEATSLMESRLMRMKNVSKEQVIRAKLLQLKLKMDEYVKNPICDDNNNFSEFLKLYIDSIYAKRSVFAEDIDVAPVSLSQVINNHREPKEEFLLKLMIHSEKVYEHICVFEKKVWFEVYYKEKICETISHLERWRPEVEKHVKLSKMII